MSLDVLLIATPNKNIDYPGLSLPALTGALRRAGYRAEQWDLNVTLRDRLLTRDGLEGLSESTIPLYARALSRSEVDLNRVLSLYRYLRALRSRFGFAALEEVKRRAQGREYTWVFETEDRFQQFLALFKLNRALHYLIDMAVVMSYNRPVDYLTCELVACIERVRAYVAVQQPLLVGLSTLDIQRACSLRLIQAIRASYHGVIAVGGADATRFARLYMEHRRDIDIVFYREAEVSLPRVVGLLEKGARFFGDVAGVLYRDANGRVVQNHHAPVDLSQTGSPDFRGLPLELYLTPALPIQASRGCCWQKCRFCIHWNTYCDFRMRDAVKVVEDIEMAVRQHGVKYFHFTDDCIPVKHARELGKMLRESGLDVRWLAYFRFEEGLDRQLLSELWASGGRVLEMGLESASNRVLGLMQKNITVETAERIVNDAAATGLLIKVFMFHGFPGETADDLRRTVDFAERHIRGGRIRPFLPLRNRFALLRGSAVYDSLLAGGDEGFGQVWEPSGLFAIGAEYSLREDEAVGRDIVARFVESTRRYMSDHKVYNTDDDNVMLDLVVVEHSPLAAGWRCV